MRRLVYGVIVLGLLAGCSSMSVQTDYSADFDFSQVRTFQYRDSDGTVAGSDQLAHQRIAAAITHEMTAAGFNEVDSDPDVVVTYYGSTSQGLRFQTTYMGANTWSRGVRAGGVGMATSSTRAVSYQQGTLVIDVWEPAENQLVWRGVVDDTLSSNPDRNTKRIKSGVERAFRDFPPS